MSTSAAKRKRDASEGESASTTGKKSKHEGGLTLTISKTGRVRKKPVKLLESAIDEEIMEELDGTKRGRKKSLKLSEMEEMSPKNVPSSKPSEGSLKSKLTKSSSPATAQESVIKMLLGSPAKETEGKPKKAKRNSTSSLSSLPSPKGEHELKLKFHLGASPSVEPTSPELEPGKSSKKLKIKKEKTSPPALSVDIPDSETTKGTESGLKLKLILSPKEKEGKQPGYELAEAEKSAKKKKKHKKEDGGEVGSPDAQKNVVKKNEESPTKPPHPGVKAKNILSFQAQLDAANRLMQMEKVKKKKKKKDEKPDEPKSPGAAISSPELESRLTTATGVPTVKEVKKKIKKEKEDKVEKIQKAPKKTKSSAPPKTVKMELDAIAMQNKVLVDGTKVEMNMQLSGADSNFTSVPGGAAPMYANTVQAALKLKTSAEKKASKKGKKGKGNKDEQAKPPKRKRAPTAYTLWCNSYRGKVVAENPGIDFASISKRLGEIWQALPEKEKTNWRRKAKKRAFKQGPNLISTGKTSGSKAGSAVTAAIAPAAASIAGTPKTASNRMQRTSITLASPDAPQLSPQKVTSCSPVDVAAHLKLLGESLSIIGSRLQEHQGQIAVQGSLSVLLDSMLCAMAPLMCLTAEVPQLNGLALDVHAKSLDNIAYIMPGL